MEPAWSTEMLVTDHHTALCSSLEKQEFCSEYACLLSGLEQGTVAPRDK
jgi:hypothetical protein